MFGRATILVFSGRPDPTWVLAPSDALLVIDRFERLPIGSESMALPQPALGYRGVQLEVDGTLLEAFGGISRRSGKGEIDVRHDPSHSIERMLIAMVPPDALSSELAMKLHRDLTEKAS